MPAEARWFAGHCFAGDTGGYTEDDIPSPCNFYGLSKLIGEFVAQRMRHHLVVRTNFVARGPWPYPRAFVDRYGSYLLAEDVAAALGDVMSVRTEGVGSKSLPKTPLLFVALSIPILNSIVLKRNVGVMFSINANPLLFVISIK